MLDGARRIGALLTAVAALANAAGAPSGPAPAATYVPIAGAGSTWASNAVTQWSANETQVGMTVNFQANGSTLGRNFFGNGTVDFGVTDVPAGLTDNGVTDPLPSRPFTSLPLIAGATAFSYNLTAGGQRITGLRLSGPTLVGIFTGTITRWNDPRVAADNPGIALPASLVVPVVRSDGAGTSRRVTSWFGAQDPTAWQKHCAAAGRPLPCTATSFFPVVPGSGTVQMNGSIGVMGDVAGRDGAITYVEASYARNARFPTAKLLNAAGYYAEATPGPVGIALLGARVVADSSALDGTLDETSVQAVTDPRAYPLAGVSYLLAPTDLTSPMTAAKGGTLGDFGKYAVCGGQQFASTLGYAPLPVNLVRAASERLSRVPGVDPAGIDLTACANPTIGVGGVDLLAGTVPQPAACDRQGRPVCGTVVTPAPRPPHCRPTHARPCPRYPIVRGRPA